MDKFHDVTSFLMLPDSEYQPDREFYVHKTGWEWLRFYEKSKEAWEVHGNDGPPAGSTVYYLHNRVWATMLGVYKPDTRFFELSIVDDLHQRTILIERAIWWRYLHLSETK
jgi:hypothetical protein